MYYMLILIPVIWILFLLSVLLHELGHALGFRIGAGKKSWKIIAGSGKEILHTERLSFRLFPVGGFFLPDDADEPGTRKGKLLTYAGGPLVSLLLTVLFFVLRFSVLRSADQTNPTIWALSMLCSALLCFNFFQFLLTALPIRYRVVCKGLRSDGKQFFHALRNKTNRR